MSRIACYRHLSLEEREQVAAYRRLGYSLRTIANRLGRSHSTVSRELARNSAPHSMMRGYVSTLAHGVAKQRKQQSGRRIKLKSLAIQQFIQHWLPLGWTPEIIASQIPHYFPGQSLSHEAIYQYIYSDWLAGVIYLPRRHKRRYPRTFSRKQPHRQIKGRVSITERSEAISTRQEFGHWESDSLESRQSMDIINVLQERQSRFVLLSCVTDKKAASTEQAILEQLDSLAPHCRQSITYDNGTENAHHQRINSRLNMRSYFCESYKSWQKGGIENMNSLIRRFIPKKTHLGKVSTQQLRWVQQLLNHRPRKCLGFKTPAQVFFKQAGALPP